MDTSESVIFVQGANRGIGLEMVRQLLCRTSSARVFASCRDPHAADSLRALEQASDGRLSLVRLDVSDEMSIASASAHFGEREKRLHLLVNVAGVLHGPGVRPEKKLAHVDPVALRTVFEVNAFGPLLVAKHFHHYMRHDARSVFASLSARVGSISDNRLGGWYAYRASKAAQNMITKTLSIELGRIAPRAIVVGLHPGTVATDLSEPFRRTVSPQALLSSEQSVASLLRVLDTRTPEHTGRVFDFRGVEICP